VVIHQERRGTAPEPPGEFPFLSRLAVFFFFRPLLIHEFAWHKEQISPRMNTDHTDLRT